jgi:archaellum component FlaF (FlaF/FlaG flagellin family)
MNKNIVLTALLSLFALGAGAQKIEVDNPLVDCGQVIFRHPSTAEFKMKNDGRKSLTIQEVRTDCGCTVVDYPRTPIAAGDSFSVKAHFDAKQMGHFTKQIGIYSNASDAPVMLTLRGVVVEEKVDFAGNYNYQIGDMKADINDVEFDDVNRGDHPYRRIHIFNDSQETLEPVVMHLPNYLKAEISPSRIAPGHGGTATILLEPQQLRNFGLTQTSVYLGMFPGDKVSPKKEITVSAVLLPSFENMTDYQRAMAPAMKLSTENLELGKFNGKKKLKGEITITNNGQSTLEVRSLQMFTTGIKVSLNKSKIAPGETAKMKVTAEANGLKMARSKPRILMITNDPNHPKVIIHINVAD